MKRISLPRATFALTLALLASCGGEETRETPPAAAATGWREVAEGDLDAGQRAQRERAVAAQKGMFHALFQTLSEEMMRAGPAGAIPVCKERAPVIAEATGKEHGVRIGRTSFRLRNPRNEPPAWVAALTASRPETPRFSAGPKGAFGAVLPIRVQVACLVCHGPEETIAEDVRRRLREDYPEDRATGFRDGDLRGWFWIEVPGAP